MDAVARAIRDLVIANRILAHNGVVDAYGHVSIRHPENPARHFLARSMSPGIVGPDDIVEFTHDGVPADPEKRPLYLERFIHGGVYEARPDINAVLHAHAEDVLPFTISSVPFRAVIQNAGDIGRSIPVWDIADKFGTNTDLLVRNIAQGRDLAAALGGGRMALMRSHGFVATGRTLNDLVRLSVFIPRNARVLMAALRLGGGLKELHDGEIAARLALDPESPALRRGWEYWATEAGCADLL
ncbi:MAG: class II aldolase/adducin family protein [Hyphomicrobiaceae bacterium]